MNTELTKKIEALADECMRTKDNAAAAVLYALVGAIHGNLDVVLAKGVLKIVQKEILPKHLLKRGESEN